MSAESFGLFANPTNAGNFINVDRSLSTAMQVGDSFSFQWGVNFDADGPGSKGFNLYVGTNQLINLNMGGSSTITINGTNTGFGYGTTAMTWSFFMSSATNLVVTANDRDGSGTYSNNFAITGGISSLRWYASQLNNSSFADQRQPYYNNLLSTNSGVFSMGGTVTNANTFTGSGNLSVGDNTTLVLSGGGNNNYSGTTTISNGSTLRFTGSGNSGFVSAISGGGLLSKGGEGTVTLSGANSSFTGKTTVTTGTLSIDSDARLGAAPGTATADQLTLSGGALATTASFALAANRGITLSTGTDSVMRVASGTGLTNNAVVTGSGNLAKEGTGTLALSAANTYSGQTRLREGVLLVGNNASFGTGEIQISFLGGFGSKTLAAEGASARTITNTLLIYNDLNLGQTSVNTGSLTFSGVTELGNEAGTRNLLTASGTSHTLSGEVRGLRGIVKQGGGTLTLAGSNSFTGALFLDNGTLDLAGGSLAAGSIDLGGGAGGGSGVNASNAVLRVSTNGTFGRTITVNAETNASGVSGTRTIEFANSGGTATLSGNVTLEKAFTANVTNSSASGVLGGVIGGTGDLTKSGNGTLVLAANNTFTGNTLVSAGALQIGNGGTAGSVGGNITNNGAVVFNRSDNATATNTISGSGSVVKIGAGTVTLNGANTFAGSVTVAQGGLSVGANNHLGAGSSITLSNGGSLVTTASFENTRSLAIGGGGAGIVVAAGTTFTNAGALSGSAALSKSGSGTLALSGNSSTYDGTVSVTGGTLQVNATNTAMGVTVTNEGSVLAGAGSLGAVTISTGGRIAPGNSPGNLSVSSLTFGAGSGYSWEVENVSGTAGTEWDLVTVGGGTGTVTFNNTLGSPLTIFISGAGTGFSNSGGYSWTIIDAGTLSGFSADAFAFNYSTINGVSPTGAFSVSDSSGDLILSYTAATTVFDITVVTGSETQSEADGGAALLDGALATVNKLGAGTLVMTNTANSYTGVTTVKEGTLEIATSVGSGSDSVLGNASSAVVVGDVAEANAAGFNFGAAVQNDRGLSVVAGTNAADRFIGTTIGAGTATQAGSVVMATNTTYSATSGGTLLVSGAVSGAGNATISGAGTVVLSGNNSYSGSTTVSANSTLVASNNNALGGTGNGTTVSSGGSLALAGSIDTPEGITIAGTGLASAGALRNVNGDNAVSGTLTLSANALVTADAGTSLQLDNVDLGTATRQLTLSNQGAVILAGNFLNTSVNSVLFKAGSGSLVISNTSANTGGSQLQIGSGSVTLAAGTFSTNNGTATRAVDLGLTSAGSNSPSDTAFYVNAGQTMSNSIYVAGGTGARILGTESTSGTATFNNEIYLDNTLRLTAASGGNVVFSGNLTNNQALTKVGNGTVTLSGTNFSTGTMTISNGTLAVSGGAALNDSALLEIASGATLAVSGSETAGQFTGNGNVSVAVGQTFSSRYSGASNTFAGTISGLGGFLKGGTGTLTLSGSNSQTGLTTHEAGVLLVGNNAALGAGIYQVDFNNATNKTIAANGSANFTLSQSNNIYNDLTLGEATGNTGKLTFSGGSFLGNEAGETRTLTVAANNSHEFSGGITGVRGIIKAGTGTLTLSGNNSYGTTFQLNEGTVLVGNNNAFGNGVLQVQFGVAGTKTIASSSTAGYTVGNNVNVFNDLNLGLASGGTGSINFGGTFYLGDEVGQNRVITTASGTGHTVSGAVTGLRGIVKQGAGTLTLSGANTSTGGLFVDDGTLQVDGGSLAFGQIDIGSGVAGDQSPNSATLRLSSGTISQGITVNNEGTAGARAIEFANATGSATLSGTVSLEKTVTADVANSAATGVLSGAVSGTGGITKTGNGTLTLSGASANTYTGLTTVSAGTLNLNKSNGNAIAGATTIGSGAVLLLSASNQVDSGAGDLVTLSGGTIRRGASVSEAFGNLNVTSNSFLDFGTGAVAEGYGMRFETYTSSALLTVQNFLPGNKLQFASGFNSALLPTGGSLSNANFSFSNGFTTGTEGGYFTITAIPEPSTYLAVAGLFALFAASAWRRSRKDRGV